MNRSYTQRVIVSPLTSEQAYPYHLLQESALARATGDFTLAFSPSFAAFTVPKVLSQAFQEEPAVQGKTSLEEWTMHLKQSCKQNNTTLTCDVKVATLNTRVVL